MASPATGIQVETDGAGQRGIAGVVERLTVFVHRLAQQGPEDIAGLGAREFLLPQHDGRVRIRRWHEVGIVVKRNSRRGLRAVRQAERTSRARESGGGREIKIGEIGLEALLLARPDGLLLFQSGWRAFSAAGLSYSSL
jgi:hypothetical protein